MHRRWPGTGRGVRAHGSLTPDRRPDRRRTAAGPGAGPGAGRAPGPWSGPRARGPGPGSGAGAGPGSDAGPTGPAAAVCPGRPLPQAAPAHAGRSRAAGTCRARASTHLPRLPRRARPPRLLALSRPSRPSRPSCLPRSPRCRVRRVPSVASAFRAPVVCAALRRSEGGAAPWGLGPRHRPAPGAHCMLSSPAPLWRPGRRPCLAVDLPEGASRDRTVLKTAVRKHAACLVIHPTPFYCASAW